MVKAKKKQMSELAQQKRNATNKKQTNPFEVQINRDKLNVLGRRSKADRGLPGISRAKGINKRKRTILQEYKVHNKDNVFLDKRIGERNSGMSAEDKAMARFAAERIRAHKKKSIFSLNDEETLTHRGQTLEEIEKFEDPKSDDDFSDEEHGSGKLDNNFVEDAHFGGGILSKPDSALSRKELIDKLIAESKKRKAEKQRIREETMDMTDKLDSEWKDLLPVISASKKNKDDPVEKAKADDYDMAVRELKFEARGMPTERLKSEEEIVKEEKEKLEALEADRLARMKGFVPSTNNDVRHKSADDLDDGFQLVRIKEDEATEKDKHSEAEKESKSTDDEDDEEEENNEDDDGNEEDEENEEENNNDEDDEKNEELDNVKVVKSKKKSDVKQSDDEAENLNAEESDGESSADNLSDLKESESSSEDEDAKASSNDQDKKVPFEDRDEEAASKEQDEKSPSESDDGKIEEERVYKPIGKEKEQEIRNNLLKIKETMEKARKELPYTYKAAESFEELQKLLKRHNAEYQSVIIDRMIKCNHPSLDKDNKEKLSHLFMYLLQHLTDCTAVNETKDAVQFFRNCDRLFPYLYDLAQLNPENAKTCVQQILKEKHEVFEMNKKKYPGLDTLVLFKVVSILFPTSDYRHSVVTPSLVFMSQILLRCRVRNRIDISKGLFICTLLLEYTVLSKRFSPGVINFLRGIIYVATPKHLVQGLKVIPPFKTIGELSNLLILENPSDEELEVDFTSALMKASDLVCEDIEDEFKLRALITAVNLLAEFKIQLEELEAAFSIFEPIKKLLKLNPFEEYPESFRKHVNKIHTEIESLRNKKLEYIVLAKKKPKPMRLYEPKIETVYDGKRHRPMSKEKAEREKLLHKYKKETKGAIREIRKDRAFLAKVQIKEQIKSDMERKRKVKELFGEAALQQSEFKKMKRQK